MDSSKSGTSVCVRLVVGCLLIASSLACSRLTNTDSVTLGVSEGAAARMAVGFIAVRNLTAIKIDGEKSSNNGIQYAKDLVDSQLYAYVECVSTENVAANGWIHKLEAAALADQVFVDTNRQLKLVDPATGDPTGIVPCKILGRRLMSYPIAQRIFTTILADGAASREALSVAQFFYLSMRGYESPNAQGSSSEMLITYARMAGEYPNAPRSDSEAIADDFEALDRELNPCSKQKPLAKGAAAKWRDENFRCFEFGKGGRGYAPHSSEAFLKLKAGMHHRIAAYHEAINGKVTASSSDVDQLWDLLTDATDWDELPASSATKSIAQILKSGNESGLSRFSSSRYGDEDSGSASLVGEDDQGGFGLLGGGQQAATGNKKNRAAQAGQAAQAGACRKPAAPGRTAAVTPAGGKKAEKFSDLPTTVQQRINTGLATDLAAARKTIESAPVRKDATGKEVAAVSIKGKLQISNMIAAAEFAGKKTEADALRALAVQKNIALTEMKVDGTGGGANKDEYVRYVAKNDPKGPVSFEINKGGTKVTQNWIPVGAAAEAAAEKGLTGFNADKTVVRVHSDTAFKATNGQVTGNLMAWDSSGQGKVAGGLMLGRSNSVVTLDAKMGADGYWRNDKSAANQTKVKDGITKEVAALSAAEKKICDDLKAEETKVNAAKAPLAAAIKENETKLAALPADDAAGRKAIQDSIATEKAKVTALDQGYATQIKGKETELRDISNQYQAASKALDETNTFDENSAEYKAIQADLADKQAKATAKAELAKAGTAPCAGAKLLLNGFGLQDSCPDGSAAPATDAPASQTLEEAVADAKPDGETPAADPTAAGTQTAADGTTAAGGSTTADGTTPADGTTAVAAVTTDATGHKVDASGAIVTGTEAAPTDVVSPAVTTTVTPFVDQLTQQQASASAELSTETKKELNLGLESAPTVTPLPGVDVAAAGATGTVPGVLSPLAPVDPFAFTPVAQPEFAAGNGGGQGIGGQVPPNDGFIDDGFDDQTVSTFDNQPVSAFNTGFAPATSSTDGMLAGDGFESLGAEQFAEPSYPVESVPMPEPEAVVQYDYPEPPVEQFNEPAVSSYPEATSQEAFTLDGLK